MILFIDSHSINFCVCLLNDGKVFSKREHSGKNHSEVAIPLINELLSDNGLTTTDLNGIIVVNGPGSFTGVRIGVTIAKTLAYSLNIPIKSITTLECLGISENDKFDIIAFRDNKGVYSALYDGEFIDYEYRSNIDFDNYINKNKFKVSYNDTIDFEKVWNYLKDKSPENPHGVNPIYVKKIDVLKWYDYYKKMSTTR